MAVIKTLKGQTVVTVVCNIYYPDPPTIPPPPPPDPEEDTFMHQIHKMASAWRVVAFFLVVFVVPVVLIALPLYARYTMYPARSLPLVASDTLDLHSMASSFWCQGQRLSSNGTFDAYLLPQEPTPNRNRRRTTTVSNIMKITDDEPEVRMVHLLKGSSLSLGVCSRWPGATVIVVQGAKNFKRCYYIEEMDLDDMFEDNVSSKAHEENQLRRRYVTKTRKSALPISNIDVFDQSDDDAREVFDDGDSLLQTLDDVETLTSKNEQTISPETTTIKLLEDSSSLQSDSGHKFYDSRYRTRTPIKYSKGKKLAITSPVPRTTQIQEDLNEIEDTKTDNSSRLIRVLRSILSGQEKVDTSDEKKRKLIEEGKNKLFKLHSVNDTRDVTAGNSSVSSSEEFMEQCTDTIFYFDPERFDNCQAQNLSANRQWSFRVNETDDYYIIFMSDNTLEENVMKYYLSLDRVMYNVTSNKEACNNSTECSFPLQFLRSEAVVVEMETGHQGMEEEVLPELIRYEVQTVCQPRVAVYMIFILLVPFIILLFAFQ